MNKKSLITTLSAVFASLFLATVLFAGGAVQDTFKIESKAYAKHTYGPVTLTHKKHAADYKIKCGQCHHDAKHKPLDNLKPTDKVQACIECHKIPGKMPQGTDPKKKMDYQAEAMHENCIKCHQTANNKAKAEGKKGAAPVMCNACHIGGKLK